MEQRVITKEEAIKVIEQYGSEDDYISANIQRLFNSAGDPDDNSIELSDYYRECKRIVALPVEKEQGEKASMEDIVNALEQCLPFMNEKTANTWELKAIWNAKSIIKKFQLTHQTKA